MEEYAEHLKTDFINYYTCTVIFTLGKKLIRFILFFSIYFIKKQTTKVMKELQAKQNEKGKQFIRIHQTDPTI